MSAKQPTVDEFLTNLDHPRVDDIRRFRTALLAGDAELIERIKWNAPSFGHDGDDRVTFRLQPGDRFELVLHRGVRKRDDPFSFDDPDHQITWATTDRGTTAVPRRMTDDEETRLLSLVHRWLQATRSPQPPNPIRPGADTTVERRGDFEVVVTRWFDAPAHLVFEAWSNPELFQRWWVPKSMGMTLHACEMDVRSGGPYRLNFGEGMDFFGRYIEVASPSLIVWTNEEGDGSVTTVTFAEHDGRTLLVMTERFPSAEALDAEGGAADATHETFRQLDELLATLR